MQRTVTIYVIFVLRYCRRNRLEAACFKYKTIGGLFGRNQKQNNQRNIFPKIGFLLERGLSSGFQVQAEGFWNPPLFL